MSAITTPTIMATRLRGEELTVAEVSERLRRHPETIRGYIRDGRLPAHRVGGHGWRIYETDLEALRSPAHPEQSAKSPEDLVSQLVATWPRLTDERRAELAVLLSTP